MGRALVPRAALPARAIVARLLAISAADAKRAPFRVRAIF